MRNIKHSFYIMVGLSFLLLMFLNNRLPGSSTHNNINEKREHLKPFLISDSNEVQARQQSQAPQGPEEQLTEIIVLEDASEGMEVTTKSTEKNEFTETGQIAYTQEQLDLLNKKIKGDPLLQKLASNFKTLKGRYYELGRRYQALSKENNQLAGVTKTTVSPFKVRSKAPSQRGRRRYNRSQGKRLNLQPVTDNDEFAALESQKKMKALTDREKQVQMVLRYSNPFYLLGAYPNITLEYFNSYPAGRPYYERFNYGLHNDLDYCEITDMYNLAHPENLFTRKTFFTDYAKNGLARKDVMRKIGFDLSPKISKFMPQRQFRSRTLHLDPRITMFFTKRVDMHIYHEIGKHFLCATQMYNHIPGHGVLKRKDLIVDSVDAYALKYKDRSSCFNKNKFFPFSYRLYIKEECETFFNLINSKTYIESLKDEPIQYLIKVGFGSHRAQGVFLLDQNQTYSLKKTYHAGQRCGVEDKSLIAQTYVTNPLLLDLKNKFDFRVYMLIGSTNPLIVFYHDGFLRVSLFPYDKYSNDRSTHLTNTDLAKKTFTKMHNQNTTLHGMSDTELRNYQMWTLERLKDYLLESGKITDENWLDNYLRPKFKEAFIHIVKMSAGAFWNQSNVFEMFGLDFMLDSDLNLWFIECNSSPQLIGTNELKTSFLTKMLKDAFEIQYAYYKSRMKRFVKMFEEIQNDSSEFGAIDYQKWREKYQKVAKNRLEPEYQISKGNSFEMIMDKNLKGAKAYFGILKKECVDD